MHMVRPRPVEPRSFNPSETFWYLDPDRRLVREISELRLRPSRPVPVEDAEAPRGVKVWEALSGNRRVVMGSLARVFATPEDAEQARKLECSECLMGLIRSLSEGVKEAVKLSEGAGMPHAYREVLTLLLAHDPSHPSDCRSPAP